jgi:hypothetical protein
MRTAFFLLTIVLTAAAQQRAELNDGDAHGDAPYLIEDGWKALLNGRDVGGWHGVDGGKPSTWFTATGIRWERLLAPTHLIARTEPGGVILNGPEGRTVNLVTDGKFGDIELYLEFMIAKGSSRLRERGPHVPEEFIQS